MTHHTLPAIIPTGVLTTRTDTYIVPALIADAGEPAGWRYVEFFTANIRNPNTRRAYARACERFFAWCYEASFVASVSTHILDVRQAAGERHRRHMDGRHLRGEHRLNLCFGVQN